MISYIRKIFQNQPSKTNSYQLPQYSLYGVGEGLLAVVGLVSIFYLFNWHQDFKEIQVEKEMIASISESLSKDTSDLNDELLDYVQNNFNIDSDQIDSSKSLVSVLNIDSSKNQNVSDSRFAIPKDYNKRKKSEVKSK